MQSVADGRQGIAQLMRQGCQELVLAPVSLAECFSGLLLVMDVGAGPEPLDDPALFVLGGQPAAQEPAIAPVRGPLQAELDLVGGAGCLPFRRVVLHMLQIGWVNNPLIVDALTGLFDGQPRVSEPLLVNEVNGKIRVEDPDYLWHGVGQLAETLLAVPQRLVGLFLGRDVARDLGGANNSASAVPDRRDGQ